MGALVFTVAAEIDPDITITPKGYGSFEVGQIGKGYFKKAGANTASISHIWQQRAFGNVEMDVSYKDFLAIEIIGEGMIAFSSPQVGSKYPTTTQPRHYFYIKSSNASLSLGNKEFLGFGLQAGLFPYKYNSDVRNLGEYLFRSIPYPLIIYADFDYPQANLAGLRFTIEGFNNLFSNDLLLHSEIIGFPTQNWSISDIAEINIFNMASIGGGVNFHHLLNVYQGKNIPGSSEGYYYDLNGFPGDSVLDKHRGTKVMARAAVDVKNVAARIFNQGEPLPYFNRNDARIYGEIDIIGLKNYDDRYGYGDISDRTFYTFGFNFPGLFIFDLINFEFEFCKNTSAFSDEQFYGGTFPNWSNVTAIRDENNIDTLKREPWRWSIYLKKSFFKDHLALTAQFARDHKKVNFHYFEKSEMSFIEALPTKKDWWWVFKTEFKF